MLFPVAGQDNRAATCLKSRNGQPAQGGWTAAAQKDLFTGTCENLIAILHYDFLHGTTATAGRATTPTFGSSKSHFWLNNEAHIAKVNFHTLDHGQQIPVHAKGETVLFLCHIALVRLIQSQAQSGAASSTGLVDADGGLFLAGKVSVKLLAGTFCQFQHIASTIKVVRGR